MEQEQKKGGQALTPAQTQKIRELAAAIQYGSIILVFQDGILMQIERNEKIRIPKP